MPVKSARKARPNAAVRAKVIGDGADAGLSVPTPMPTPTPTPQARRKPVSRDARPELAQPVDDQTPITGANGKPVRSTSKELDSNKPSRSAEPRGSGTPTGTTETSGAGLLTAVLSLRPSKAQAVLTLLRGEHGASLAELQAATGWQAHSVRGFLSGTVRKRMGLDLTSQPDDAGTRRYALAKG